MELLRLATAGSVDDGKSTLIGRLLYDARAVYEDQVRAERCHRGRVAEEIVQQFRRDALRERGHCQLAIVRLAVPCVLVARTRCEQEQDPCIRHRLHERVDDGLRLCIDPVKIFDDQTERPALALAQKEPPNGLEGAAAPLSRLECLPGGILGGHAEDGQQRGQCTDK